MNILVVRLKSIGDILFTLPAVHQVRSAFPGSEISFLVSREHASLLEGFGPVNHIIALDRRRIRRPNPKTFLSELLSLLRQLRRGRFSLAIDFQGYGETALFTWVSGAPQRWGMVYRTARKWAYTQAVRRDLSVHPADSHLALLQQCGLPVAPPRNEFQLPAQAIQEARSFLAGERLDSAKPILFLQPFTSSADKDWPLEHYLAIAHHWRDREWQVLFGGGPGEVEALAPARSAGFPVSAGVPLLVTGGLMSLSTLVLGGDTGVVHLAVALGKRVVMLMGCAHPGSCYPFGHRDWVVVPAAGGSLATIQPEVVNAACSGAASEELKVQS